MGSALEVGKLVCASWLKANWEKIPRFMKIYMSVAVVVLMLITSMGIFGFLSKAHNDQNLVSGDVQSKIAVYDEKIKTAKENIEADRKQLKQMDEAVDQIMGRSSDEKGADKANAVRKSQQRDRAALAKDIETNQKLVSSLNDEAAPIRAEVRKVDAEVGPIKYIAAFLYGTEPDASMLERAVTWIIILIVIVFDPLAVIMLLGAQMTFGWAKEEKEKAEDTPDPYVADVGEKPTAEELVEGDSPTGPVVDIVSPETTATEPTTVDFEGVRVPGGEWIQTGPEFQTTKTELTADSDETISELDKWNRMIEEAEKEVAKQETTVEERLATGQSYIDSAGKETPTEATLPEPDFPVSESKKKTYMIKDPTGQIQTKTRDQ